MDQAFPYLEELGVHTAAESITREALIGELKKTSDNEIGSDGYAKDAVEAVQVAKAILNVNT